LFFTSDFNEALQDAKLIFIAISTPLKKKGYGSGLALNLQYIENCIREISLYYSEIKMSEKVIIVLKSTVPV